LTAAALQLNLADQAPDKDRKSRLDLVKRLLASEQRRIREFVDKVYAKPVVEKYSTLGSDLEQQLEETAQYWNCKTSLSVVPPDTSVSNALANELALLLAEAVANAVRHGGASNIDVKIEKGKGSLVINVRDNGKGFNSEPIEETRRELVVAGTGAASVRERVCALGGSLTVSSSPTGAELAIRLPVP
jgi:signal transduction histidine kinase